MSNRRTKLKTRKQSLNQKLLFMTVGTECVVRIVSAAISVIMAIAAIYCFLISGNSIGGVVLSIFALLFVCVAVGYKKIDVSLKELKISLRF